MKSVSYLGLYLGLLMAATVFMTSCQKGDDGAEGPAGPAGETGAQGPKGETGTANVIYSDWLDVKFDAVTNPDDDKDTLLFVAHIRASKLTTDMLNTGEIKVYWNLYLPSEDDYVYFPLPLNYPALITPIFYEGGIELDADRDYTTRTYIATNKKSSQFRYVIIPGSVKANSKIDWNDYNQVKNYCKLSN